MNPKEINQKEFELALSSNFVFENNPHIGLSISGGPDSMALFLLMKKCIKKLKGKISVFHFNHNLRSESGKEAEILENIVTNFRIDFYNIEWQHDGVVSKVMETSRDERYKRIIELCEKMKIIHLMTAHNYEDNVETYWMRKKRGYSTLGLSSIPKIKILDNVQILRPLLSFRKKRLIATCKAEKIKYFNDPSNINQKYERVRVRNCLKIKEIKELQNIEKSFEQQKKKNLFIEKKVSKFFTQKLTFYKYGVFELKIKDLKEHPNELKMEILKKILSTCASKDSIPRIDSMLNFLNKIEKNSSFTHTLNSCIIKVSNNEMKIYKEITNKFKEYQYQLGKGKKILWQKRFEVESNKTNIKIKNINEQNWAYYKSHFSLKKYNLNFLILKTLPLIFVNKKVLIPFLSPKSGFEKYGIKFTYKPMTPLLKKNFF